MRTTPRGTPRKEDEAVLQRQSGVNAYTRTMTIPAMPRALVLAVCTLALLWHAGACGEARDDGAMAGQAKQQRAWIDLAGARVLASPGVPRALWQHLPAARVESLTWPLPPGPLVLVGLPALDGTAAELGDALDLLPWGTDQAGGYDLWAWHDGTRPMAVLLAADAAALLAARFAFTPDADPAALDPSMRPVNVAMPNAAARVALRAGHHRERPLCAWRAYRTQHVPERAAWPALLGARVNRLWLDNAPATAPRAAKRARAFGVQIVPCVAAAAGENHKSVTEVLRARAAAWQSREVAVDLRASPGHLPALLEGLATLPGHVERVYIDGATPSRARAAQVRADGPEAVFVQQTREVLLPPRRVVYEAPWAAASATTPQRLPTRLPPHRRLARTRGVMSKGRLQDALLVLEDGWRRDASVDAPRWPLEHAIAPGLALATDPWQETAEVLQRIDRHLGPAGVALRRSLQQALTKAGGLRRIVPLVGTPFVVDGHRNEAGWRHALPLHTTAGEAGHTLWAVSDGWSLLLAWRGTTRARPLRLDVSGARVHVDPRRERIQVTSAVGHRRTIPLRATAGHSARERRAELRLDRLCLRAGDAHPGQTLRYAIHMEGETTPSARGTLLVLP